MAVNFLGRITLTGLLCSSACLQGTDNGAGVLQSLSAFDCPTKFCDLQVHCVIKSKLYDYVWRCESTLLVTVSEIQPLCHLVRP